MDYSVFLFIMNAILGAFTNVLMWSKRVGDLATFRAFKHVVIGGIAGYVYWLLHEVHHVPDGVMSFVVGYVAEDFINWVARRFKPKY